MQQSNEIEIDELAIGLTKPATKLGVPLKSFFLSMIMCFFGWIVYQGLTGDSGIMSTVISFTIWLMSYTAMLLVTSRDIFGLTIYWINLQYFRPHSTRIKWGNTDAYQP